MPLRRLAILIVIVLSLLLLSCDLAGMVSQVNPLTTPTAVGGGAGRIAFVSNREDNEEIYIMNVDGSQLMNLSNNPASDTSPAWSPDGARIAFISNRDGNNEIYVMNANGAYQMRLTNHWATDEYPAWSPDGARIAFGSKRDGDYEVYVMNTDGSNVVRLTDTPAPNDQPAWSPDGRKIVFVSERDGNKEIYVMNADSSQPTRLTNNSAVDWFPKWSPDGKRIVFVSYRDGNLEIYVMNADGSQQTRLTSTAGRDFSPMWSPDGAHIVFNSERDGNFEIYLMKADGSLQTRLTNHQAPDRFPAWQPKEPSADALKTPWVVARVTAAPTPTATLTPTQVPLTPLPTDALTPTLNISGTWDSNLGKVTLALWKSDASRSILVSGSWTQPDGNLGLISNGTFDPQSRVLDFAYYQLWNKVTGTARFTLSPDSNTLKGTWKQGQQQGDWTMQRTSGAVTPTIPVTGTTVAPTHVSTPATQPVATLTAIQPTRAPATATAIPAAPGLYANAIRIEPREPHSGNPITFHVTFLNTTGGTLHTKWFVKIFEPDKKNSFGETAKVTSTIPVGTSTFATGNDWRTRVGVCTTFIARVFGVDASNTIYEFTKSNGSSTATSFLLCP